MSKDKTVNSPLQIIKRRYGVPMTLLTREQQLFEARLVLAGLAALSASGCSGYSRLDAKGVDVSACVSTSNEDQCDKEPPRDAESEDTNLQR